MSSFCRQWWVLRGWGLPDLQESAGIGGGRYPFFLLRPEKWLVLIDHVMGERHNWL